MGCWTTTYIAELFNRVGIKCQPHDIANAKKAGHVDVAVHCFDDELDVLTRIKNEFIEHRRLIPLRLANKKFITVDRLRMIGAVYEAAERLVIDLEKNMPDRVEATCSESFNDLKNSIQHLKDLRF